jgi:hypothetical protein
MAKTLALFFVLGLLSSCATYQNDRDISSVEQPGKGHDYYERTGMGSRF